MQLYEITKNVSCGLIHQMNCRSFAKSSRALIISMRSTCDWVVPLCKGQMFIEFPYVKDNLSFQRKSKLNLTF